MIPRLVLLATLSLLLVADFSSSYAGEPSLAQAGQVQTGTTPPVGQERRPPPQGRQGRGGPADRVEAEQRLRQAIITNLRQSLALPDSQMEKLAAVAFRYRDSSLVLQQRERMIREMLSREGGPGGGRRAGGSGAGDGAGGTAVVGVGRGVPDDARITCLIGEFWHAQETRLQLRRAEDREVAAMLSPTNRYRYLAFQDNLHGVIDEFVEQMNRQFGRRGEPGGAGAGGSRGVAGPPAGGRRGGGGGASGQGRPGGPGGPGGRGPLNQVCPPGAGRGRG